MAMKRVTCGFILVILASVAAGMVPIETAETNPVPGLTRTQVLAVIDNVSGLRALDHIEKLCLHHRWFVSDGYDTAPPN